MQSRPELSQRFIESHITDPQKRKREQAKLNGIWGRDYYNASAIFNSSQNILNKLEISHVNARMSTHDEHSAFSNFKIELRYAISQLAVKVEEYQSNNTLSKNDAYRIAVATRELVISGNTEAFEKTANSFNHIKHCPTWISIITACVSAAAGFFAAGLVVGGVVAPVIGAAMGAYSNPLTSFFAKPIKLPTDEVSTLTKELYADGVGVGIERNP